MQTLYNVNQSKSFVKRIGYGSIVVPPLLIITVITFSFIIMKSHATVGVNTSAASSLSSPKSTVSNPAELPTLPITPIKSLPAVDSEVKPSTTTSSTPENVAASTATQNTNDTSNSLQAATSDASTNSVQSPTMPKKESALKSVSGAVKASLKKK